ncbi:MAG: ferritin-like fold-containing protein [Aeromicrobium sp.]
MTTSPSAFDDETYRAGVVELLGALAYGEISACERIVDDARMAPDLRTRVEIAMMAASEFDHFIKFRDSLVSLGVDPFSAMEPFTGTFESFHRRTAPSDYLEGLVKMYVGDGLAADFYSEIAAFLDAQTRELIVETMSGTSHSEFVVTEVRKAIDANPKVAGRLALWGRRLMGEALSQAQGLVAQRDALTSVMVGGVNTPGLDLMAIGRMFTRVTEAHTERMAALGLEA